MCSPFASCTSAVAATLPQGLEPFLDTARRRIRTQNLRVQQIQQEAEECKLMALDCARHNDRVGVAGHLRRQRRLEEEHRLEWDQCLALEGALAIVKRAANNQVMALHLDQVNSLLAAGHKQDDNVERAMETLRAHHTRVAMDANELAAPIRENEEDEEELDDFIALSLALPDAPKKVASAERRTAVLE